MQRYFSGGAAVVDEVSALLAVAVAVSALFAVAVTASVATGFVWIGTQGCSASICPG
jgi:hypothetical protein